MKHKNIMDFETKIAELIEKKHLTDEDKKFLRARRSYILDDVFKGLDLELGKKIKVFKDDKIDEASKEEVEETLVDILSNMTVKELKELAEANNIELGEATKKDDIIKVIDEKMEQE